MRRPRAGKRPAPDAALVLRTSAAEETQAVGEALGRLLRRGVPQDSISTSTLLALEGPLGSGKTCFVQGLARGLGASGAVRSPTFTLIHEHPGPVPLRHVDLYRLGAADLESLGLEELLDAPGVVAVEWPDRAAGALPAERLVIELRFGAHPSGRRLRIVPVGTRYARLAAALERCVSSP